jgi:hypothetical protein
MSVNAFENLTGTRVSRNIEVLRIVGRNPLRYECFCHFCCSSFVISHTKLVNEGAVCQNVACRLGRITPRPPVPPTEKPAFEPPPVAAPKVSNEYTRYVNAMRSDGHPESSIAGWETFKQLDGEHLKRVMAPVEAIERRQQGKELGQKWDQEFRRKYGIK